MSRKRLCQYWCQLNLIYPSPLEDRLRIFEQRKKKWSWKLKILYAAAMGNPLTLYTHRGLVSLPWIMCAPGSPVSDKELGCQFGVSTAGSYYKLTYSSQSQYLKILSLHLLHHYKPPHHHHPHHQSQRCSGNQSFLKHFQLLDLNWRTCFGLLLACTAKAERTNENPRY